MCFAVVATLNDIKVSNTSHWAIQSRFNLSSTIEVVKYKSSLTGLTIVLTKAESPIVHGYLCLATKADDNDGLAHTLEHLVFLRSEDYPYRGIVHPLASRCLADRVNAWTSHDHTCYTISTAGTSGLLAILPVFMDHILYPTLREQDFITDVHHVDHQGQDAGVVYSEMQVFTYFLSHTFIAKLNPNSSLTGLSLFLAATAAQEAHLSVRL